MPTVRESILEDWFVDFDHRLRIIIHTFPGCSDYRSWACLPAVGLADQSGRTVCVSTREVGEPACKKCEVGAVVNVTLSRSVTFH